MKSPRTLLSLLVAVLALATASHANTSAPTAPDVSVHYDHPEKFTETRETRALAPTRASNDYLETLSQYIQKRAAARLKPGEKLQVVITDIDRAGSFEPWHGPRLSEVRIIKDIYPPRIDLHFSLRDASGKVIEQGQRKLRDPAFMYDQTGIGSGSDSLIYEKKLIDRWLRGGPGHL